MDKRNINIKLGIESEKAFELECVKRDIQCYHAISATQSDYVIYTNGILLRVQVKSSDADGKNIPVKCSWGRAKTGWKEYTEKETDLIAVYIRKRNDWYIIPVYEVKGLLGLNISETCKFSEYKNNWNFGWINKSPERKDSIFDAASKLKSIGETNDSIAAKLGRTTTYISRLLRRGGAGQKDRLSAASKEALTDMYNIQNLTMDQIAAKLNISTWFIRKKFREYGIQVRTNPNPKGRMN